MGGKMSIEKYKIDKKRQEEFSNRMKLWWKERKEKLASELRGI
jgi:hypothetical protein